MQQGVTITVTAPATQTATVGVSKSITLGSFAETGATGPYTATVAWGDGTTSTIKLTAAGTIPATAHTYAKAATDSVSVTVTDSASHASNKATFSVAVSAVTTAKITVTAPAAQTATVGVSKSFALGSFAETNATGPYTATVAWGDGTTGTIKLTAAGTIPATSHTYVKAATDSVSVTITDSASHTSNKATFSVTVSPATTAKITLTAPAAQTATVGVSKSFSLGSFTETGATGPYTATIVWGDGTANTTIKLTAAGTIPATTHTYAKTGSDTVSVTVTDSASHTSNKATFAVTVSPVPSTGVISGTVFNDANLDKKLDDNELGLGGYVVFIDLKGTGKFVTGDPTVTTSMNGAWSFANLAAGTYKISVEPATGAALTTPAELTVTIAAGGKSISNLFGEKAIA